MNDSLKNFLIRKPVNAFLAEIVDHYFFIDLPVSCLSNQAEFMIPFPRITFGYFFESPFTVTNHTLKESELLKVIISRISTDKITVQPTTDRIKILGAHLKPYGLAYLTNQSIHSLPWLINTEKLFGNSVREFMAKINNCETPDAMFDEVETVFLDHILHRNLSHITRAIELIELNAAHLEVKELANQLDVSERTLRNYFHTYIGCSPKDYLRIVKLRQIAFQLTHSEDSLTNMAYDHHYFDQAHFIREVKNLTGHSPKQLRKEIPGFRFLQF